MKLGLICFANDSGLGNQTRRLAYMLRPHRLLVIDSTSFSKNKKQHFDWFSDFSGYRVNGFPSNSELMIFLREVTHVIVCESPFNYSLFSLSRAKGIKTYCQSNYEFCDNLIKPHLPLPDAFLMPSHWKIAEMNKRFPMRVMYLPPPIDPAEFADARTKNIHRKDGFSFLHVVGTLAASDRNGTLDLLAALHHTDAAFTLTIRSQHELPPEYMTDDRRVRYVIENEPDLQKVYSDHDCLVLPRRYGGLALTCNEALMSGIPVIMPNISPNNDLLPREWLVNATKTSQIQTRDLIDVYSTDPKKLAEKMEFIMIQERETVKLQAFDLAYETFSPTKLLPKYEALLK